MLSKTRSTPGRSPVPGVIPDTITGPSSNGSLVATPAKRKTRAAAHAVPEPASKKFVIFEDNGGGYHWTILAGGETLVRSPSFASYEDAMQAARVMHAGVCSASFEDSCGDTDLPDPRDAATARDALDAERWLDEGGSFSSEAVAR